MYGNVWVNIFCDQQCFGGVDTFPFFGDNSAKKCVSQGQWTRFFTSPSQTPHG